MNNADFMRELSELTAAAFRMNRILSKSAIMDCDITLSPLQVQALFTISRLKKCNMTELADQLLMTRQQLTKVVDTLVEKRLVERTNNPNNRKFVILELTDVGKTHINDILDNGPTIEFLNTISEEDADYLFDVVIKVKEMLSKYAPPQNVESKVTDEK